MLFRHLKLNLRLSAGLIGCVLLVVAGCGGSGSSAPNGPAAGIADGDVRQVFRWKLITTWPKIISGKLGRSHSKAISMIKHDNTGVRVSVSMIGIQTFFLFII